MGLQQRQRRIRLGFTEAIALLLMGGTLAAAYWVWAYHGENRWIQTSAYVTGIQRVTGAGGEAEVVPGKDGRLRIQFSYMADGRVFQGHSEPGVFAPVVNVALPQELRDLLASRGYATFDDLPPVVRQALADKGVTSFSQIPLSLVTALREKGYESLDDVPLEIRDALRDGDYAAVAQAIKDMTPAPSDPYALGVGGNGGAGATRSRTQMRASWMPGRRAKGAAPGNSLLTVRYNPAKPWEHSVSYLPAVGNTVRIVLFAICVLATLGYCGVLYPRMKQRA